MLGILSSDLVLTPASPRVTDAAIDGLPCRTAVLAMGRHSSEAQANLQPVLVDGRPLREGWFMWPAYGGILYLPDLRADLGRVTPAGMDLVIGGTGADSVHLSVHAGAVVVVDFMLRAPAPAPSLTHSTHAGAQSGSLAPAPAGAYVTGPEGPPIPDPASDTTEPTPASPQGGPFRAVFLIFSPDYLPEMVDIIVSPGIGVQGVLQQVDAARPPPAGPVFHG